VNGETETRMATTVRTVRRAVLATIFAACCALSLAGCKSGTITDSEQAC
jgi:hypothetical protein